MIRPTILAGAILSLALTAACEKAADDQQKATNAQTEANDQIAAAKKEADTKAATAQAEADKKIGSAQASFSKLVEDYRHKTTTDLVDLDHKVDDLDAKAKKSTGKVKADLDANLKQIRASRDAFGADLKSLDTAAATTWDASKARLDKEMTDLKALVDKA